MEDWPPKIDKAAWPKDTKTLPELFEVFIKEVPSFDDQVEDLIRRSPDLVTFKTDARGNKRISDYKLGRIVAVSILNFLFRAYGRPDLGYIPRKRPDKPH